MTADYNKQKGIAMILCSAFAFSMMNVFSRLAGDIPVMQKTFFRNLVAVAVICFLLWRRGTPVRLKRGCLREHLLRSLFGIVSMVGNFYAVDHMLLSDATMIMELNPFFVIVFSSLLLGEKATGRQYGLIALSLLGAVFVVKPSPALFTSGSGTLFALVASVITGAAYTMVRKLTLKGEDGMIIILFFSVFSCCFCLPSLIVDHTSFSPFQLLMLLGMAVCGCCGQFSVTAAYRFAPAAEITIFDYSQILFAALLGWIFFRQMADGWSYIGYAIILAAAILMFLLNRKNAVTGVNS